MLYPSTLVINSSEGPEPPGLFDQGTYDKYFDDSHSAEISPQIPLGLQILNHNNFKNNHILDDSGVNHPKTKRASISPQILLDTQHQ